MENDGGLTIELNYNKLYSILQFHRSESLGFFGSQFLFLTHSRHGVVSAKVKWMPGMLKWNQIEQQTYSANKIHVSCRTVDKCWNRVFSVLKMDHHWLGSPAGWHRPLPQICPAVPAPSAVPGLIILQNLPILLWQHMATVRSESHPAPPVDGRWISVSSLCFFATASRLGEVITDLVHRAALVLYSSQPNMVHCPKSHPQQCYFKHLGTGWSDWDKLRSAPIQ